MKSHPSLLAIDPGHREIGLAHFIAGELVDCGVKSLRRAGHTNLSVLRHTVTRMLDEKQPQVLAIEKNNFAHIPQNQSVMQVCRTIERLARARDIAFIEYAANTVKKAITGDGRATKRALSKVICAQYQHLNVFRNTGCIWKDRYHQNMFDAIAVGLTHLRIEQLTAT